MQPGGGQKKSGGSRSQSDVTRLLTYTVHWLQRVHVLYSSMYVTLSERVRRSTLRLRRAVEDVRAALVV